MIVGDKLLRAWAESGGVKPFDPACINPASVDLRWSGKLKVGRRHPQTTSNAIYLDEHPSEMWTDEVTPDCHTGDYLFLYPEHIYMLDTLEYITVPKNWAGQVLLKSSASRKGLEILHAGFYDPGFHGTGTFIMQVAGPWGVRIAKGQRLIQIVFQEVTEVERDYTQTGHYAGQVGPTEAR